MKLHFSVSFFFFFNSLNNQILLVNRYALVRTLYREMDRLQSQCLKYENEDMILIDQLKIINFCYVLKG